jgi:hypothetical protein
MTARLTEQLLAQLVRSPRDVDVGTRVVGVSSCDAARLQRYRVAARKRRARWGIGRDLATKNAQ